MAIIGVDYGNVNTKTSYGFYQQSKICKDQKVIELRKPNDENLIELQYKKALVGEGEFQTDLNKLDKDMAKMCILSAIAKSSEEKEFKVVIGIPNNQYNSKNRDKLKNELLSDKMFQLKIGGEERILILQEVESYPEGHAPYYGMTKPQRELIAGYDLVLVNIGGGNTNISHFKIENGKRKLAKGTTVMSGVLNMYQDFINAINGEFSLNKNIEDAESILTDGLEIYGARQDLSFIKDIIIEHSDRIFKDLNTYPIKTAKVMFTGGGSKVYKTLLKKRVPGCLFQENWLMATAYGLKKVGETLWREEYL